MDPRPDNVGSGAGRAVLALLAAVLWGPARLCAQGGADKTWRIAFLSTGSRPRPGQFSQIDALLAGLRQRGHERQVSEAWFADGQLDRLPGLAQQVLRWRPDLIVTLLTPAAAAAACGLLTASVALRAQVPVRIGVLSPTALASNQPRLEALKAALAELGYAEGGNLAIEYRFAGGRFERFPEMARELVAQPVRLIVAINTPAALAAAAVPGATPVLFASVGDPVAVGLVPDLSRPGGKVSGVTNMARDLSQKRMQLLRELLPAARRLAVLTNPVDPIAASQEADVRAAAPALGFELRFLPVREVSELPEALRRAAEWPADALLRVAKPLLTQHRAQLARALLELRMPAMMVTAQEVREGGLMSYFGVEADEYRVLADYIDRVLKGAPPAELPVQQPTRFALVINLATARRLGVAVPASLRLRADEVIA